jgi:hypothetical protein
MTRTGGLGDIGGHGGESGCAKQEADKKSDQRLSDLIALQFGLGG